MADLNNASMFRGLLVSSGSCKYSTFSKDFRFKGSRDAGHVTYRPGIIDAGRHSPLGGSAFNMIPNLCSEFITDRNIGDSVYLDIIEKNATLFSAQWNVAASYWYLIGGMRNSGFQQWEVDLVLPTEALSKTEVIYWDKEYFGTKDWGTWFDELSSMAEATFRITID